MNVVTDAGTPGLGELSAGAPRPTSPRLRRDLVVSRQDEADGEQRSVAFVVKNPTSGRFFRFRAVEGFILEQLDGVCSLEVVRHRVERKFAAPLGPATLEQFIKRLHSLGLLERAESAESAPREPHAGRSRIRGNLFHLRAPLFDPDRLFARLVVHLGAFFTPAFIFLSAILIVAAGFITAANWLELQFDLPRLYNAPSLALAYLTMLIVIAAHECAHGLTCKFFGGNVREIGFLLLLLQPAFYCNVSDAWLFPQRSRRLWVTFAGAYFEVFIWALATFIWRLTEPWTVVNYLALVVLATSGIKTLFNLNPLIKLDGYYLLSDWLGIPNLRPRAFAHLGRAFRWLWGGDSSLALASTARERRIYWIYGLLAWSYTAMLLGIVLWALGRWLVGRYQGWGFILLLLLSVGIFQHPLRKLWQPATAGAGLARGMKRSLKWVVRLAVLAGLASVLWYCRTELRIGGSFVIRPIHNADVRAEVEGIIQEVYVDEGAVVQKGELVVRLSDRDLRAEMRKLQAELEEKQAHLNLLKAGTRREEIELAKTLLAKAEERLGYVTNRLEMDRLVFEARLVSKREFEETKELVAVRRNELQEARDKLALLIAGSRKEDIDAIEAEISRLTGQRLHVEEQLKLLAVASPISGVITTYKLKDKVGEAVKKGDLIAKVHDLKTVTVEIAVPELEIADVAVGQKVFLKVRAFPQPTFESTVLSISPVARAPEDVRIARTVLVTTQLDNSSLLLKPEMTGHAKIQGGERRLIDLVTRRLVRFFKVEFWSWW
jgi:multidrug resistance efflux pump